MVNLPTKLTAASAPREGDDGWAAIEDRNTEQTPRRTAAPRVVDEIRAVCDGYDDRTSRSIHGCRVKAAINYAALNNGIRTGQRDFAKHSQKASVTYEHTPNKSDSTELAPHLVTESSVIASSKNDCFWKVRLDHSYCKQIDSSSLISEHTRKKPKSFRESKREHANSNATQSNFQQQSRTRNADATDELRTSSSALSNRQKLRSKKTQVCTDTVDNKPANGSVRSRVKKLQASTNSTKACDRERSSRIKSHKKQSNDSSSSSKVIQKLTVPQDATQFASTAEHTNCIRSKVEDITVADDGTRIADEVDDEQRLLQQLEARERAQRERESALRAAGRASSMHEDFVVDLGGVRIRPSRRRASKLPPNAIDLITAESQQCSSKRISLSSGLYTATGISMLPNTDSKTSAVDPVIHPAYTQALDRIQSRSEEDANLSTISHHIEVEAFGPESLLLDETDPADEGDLITVSNNATELLDAVPSTAASTDSPAKLVENLAQWLTAMRQDEAEVLLEELLDPAASEPNAVTASAPMTIDSSTSTPMPTAIDVLQPVQGQLCDTSFGHTQLQLPPNNQVLDELVVTVSRNERDSLDSPRTMRTPSSTQIKPDSGVNFGNSMDLPPKTENSTNPVATCTRTPQLTTVSMFWNDLPALVIDDIEYVRLVDIHKQMLPAKPTGLLKTRALQLGARVVPCTDLERDFLIRYAHAATAKSNWCVSLLDAKRLVTYYVNPLNHHRHSTAHAALTSVATVAPSVSPPPTSTLNEGQLARPSLQRRPNRKSKPRSQINIKRLASAKQGNRMGLSKRKRMSAVKSASNRCASKKAASVKSEQSAVPNAPPVGLVDAANVTNSTLSTVGVTVLEEDRSTDYYIESSSQFGAGVSYAAASGNWSTQYTITHELGPDLSSNMTQSAASFRVPARMIVHTTAVRR